MLTAQRKHALNDIPPVLAAVYMTLPEVWTKPLRIGQVSLMNVLFILCLAVALRGIRRRENSTWLWSAFGLMIYMAFRGLANRGDQWFDWKIFSADMLTFFGVIAGILWARRMPAAEMGRLARLIVLATLASLILDWACLSLGIVKPSWDGPRVFVFSMFFGTWWLMALMPFILATEGLGKGILSVRFSRLLLLAAVTVMLGVAVTSGTRSVIFELIASAAFCSPLVLRNFRTAYAAAILAIFIGATASTVIPHVADFQFFADRLAATDVTSEERYTELRMMMDQLTPAIISGEGFGSSFVSPVVVDGSNLAMAPHVGVLTLLFKGGLLVFGLAVLVPAGITLFYLVVHRDHPQSYGCMAGAACYLIAGSLSGGWGFFHLFLFGLMFGGGLTFARTRVAAANAIHPRVLLDFLIQVGAREGGAVPQGISALH